MSGLLAGVNYDPGTAVATNTTAAAAVMTAIDTTNLRLTFDAPANGIVWCRMHCSVHGGGASIPQILMGAMNGAAVVGRQSPLAPRGGTNAATTQFGYNCGFPITGLTPAQSYSLDAAYGVETGAASSAIKYGGPNNTTTNDNFGGFTFEIWDTPNLLGAIMYDPAVAVNKATTSLLAMTAIDTTNLRITFTAPTSGNVLVTMQTVTEGGGSVPMITHGVLDGSSVLARTVPTHAQRTQSQTTTDHCIQTSQTPVTGLTPGNSYTWDAAYGVEIVVAATGLKYGGPDNTVADDAWGGLAYCIWAI